LRAFGGFETSERKPEFDGEGDDFDSTGEKNPGVGRGGFEVDCFFPQTDGVWNMFES
jgi:hypothetical protein